MSSTNWRSFCLGPKLLFIFTPEYLEHMTFEHTSQDERDSGYFADFDVHELCWQQ